MTIDALAAKIAMQHGVPLTPDARCVLGVVYTGPRGVDHLFAIGD